MVHIKFPEDSDRQLSFYLATEEYVARFSDIPNAFFIWQVKPSVIFGRNQLIEQEVNVKYCEEHGVKMYRRKSGGGCVYADMSNMMLAYITHSDSVNFTYHQYTTLVINALRRIGIPATANGRNDIMIEEKKVSGNAFYRITPQHTATGTGRAIVHGTMLYDTDMQNMVNCITPDDEKLISKGVKSIRQHITLLKNYTDRSLPEVRDSIIQFVCTDSYTLTAEEIRKIEEIEQEYLSPSFIFGNNPRYTVVKKQRIENVGSIEVRMEVKNQLIKDIDFKGDFFVTGDLNELCLLLKDKELNADVLAAALPDSLDSQILNLKKTDLINLILQ